MTALDPHSILTNPPKNLILQEAAIYLRISVSKLRMETTRRSIKVARMGRRLVYRLADLDAYQARLVA